MKLRQLVLSLVCALMFLAPSARAQVSDFSVSKTGPATAYADNDVSYNITVTNNGPDPGAVTVSDPVTGGWSFVSVTAPAGFVCSAPGAGATTGTVTCTAASMAPGSAIINIVFHIPPGTPNNTSFTNTATVTSPTDPNNANNTASATTTTPLVSDLTVLKTGPSTVTADTDVSFTITVTNLGPDTANTVQMQDNVIGGWTFVSVTPAPGFTCTDPGAGATTGLVTCNGGPMSAGSNAVFTIVFHIPPATPAGTTFTNVAAVSSPTDSTEENNTNAAQTSTPPPPMGDVSITKTGPTSAAPASDVTYSIMVTNSGPSAAANVSWSDTLPSGTPPSPMTFVSFSQNSGPAFNCGVPAATTTCTIASFAAGSTATFTFVGHIPSGTPSGTGYSNSVLITSDNDPNSENNGSNTSLTVSTVDVAVNKTGPATAVAGGPTYAYVVTLSNGGPDPASDVSFSDTLPAGVTFVSVVQNTGPAAVCSGGANVTCSISSPLANMQSAQFTITVQPLASIPNGTVLSNTATAITSSADTNGANDSSTVMTTVSTQADVSINKSGPATALAGNTITYTITVANAGPSNASNVSWTDTLPANTTFVSENQNTGPTFSCTTGATVTCSIATLASGANATFSIVVQVSPSTANATVLSNTATVTSTTSDTNTGNNGSTTMTTVSTQADVSIVKTAPLFAEAGTNMTYNITVANAGPSNASTVAWTDTLPANTTFVSENQTTGPTFSCTTGATVSCNIATLAPGASATFTIVVQVSSSTTTGTTISNTASVTSTTADSNTTNNSSTAMTTVSTSADLSVTKSGPANTLSNTTATYNVSVSNAGPSAAANATLTDNVPANMTFASASQMTGPAFNCTTPPAGGTGAITCTIASLASGASASFQFVFNVPPGVTFGTQTTNTAMVSATTPDSDPSDNSASVTTTIAQSIPALSNLMMMALGLVVAALALAALRR